MADENVSALPSAARAKLVQLQGMDTPPSPDTPPSDPKPDVPAEPKQTPDAPPSPPDTPNADEGVRVTLSREELNDLKATAGQVRAMEARLADSEARNEALMQRLTELDASHKGNPNPPPPAAPSPAAPRVELTEAQFTDEEEERFGDSREYVEKVAQNAAIKLLKPLLSKLDEDLSKLHSKAETTTQTLEQQQRAGFNKELSALVPNLRDIIRHKVWARFLDETDELTGDTMEQILGRHITRMNAAGAANVYKRFEKAYMENPKPTVDDPAYAGAMPGGISTPPADPNAPKAKLKLSDRTKASKDYIAGRITYDQLQEVNNKFAEAEKAGNVDYNS